MAVVSLLRWVTRSQFGLVPPGRGHECGVHMETLEFDSTDLGAAEEFLGKAYARMRIASDCELSRTRVRRRWLGPVNFDELTFDYELSYDAAPLNRICLVRVHTGYMAEDFIGEPTDVFLPGDVTFLSPPEIPYSGRTRANYDLAMFEPEFFNRVASTAPASPDSSVRLTGHRPVSADAAQQLSELIDYLRDHVLTNPAARASKLITTTAASHLAASVLNTFPNTALIDPTSTDRHDSTPVLLRRAMAFIEENAHNDIALADIAAAICVTPRAVQYMFRKHLDCTPMQYL